MRTDYGFVRVAAMVPRVHVADPERNAGEILGYGEMLDYGAVQLAVFPELGITGYTCGDLFDQDWLQEQAFAALDRLLHGTPYGIAYVVGMPLAIFGQRFNVAVVFANGQPLAVIPKVHLPNYKEFYEGRWFRPASELRVTEVDLLGYRVPIGTDVLIELVPREGSGRPFRVGVEICEDLWMPNPPSSHHALAGATILVNPSASPVAVAKADYRRALVTQQSARCVAGYVYAGAGPHESSSDVVFDGHALVAENGSLLQETKRFAFDPQHVIADIDVERLERERRLTGSFSQGIAADRTTYRIVHAEVTGIRVENGLERTVDPYPFVPSDPTKRDERCEEVFAIQTTGLRRRLEHLETATGNRKVTIGVSGGLDSTLAFLDTVRVFDDLGWDRTEIRAVTMPGFGTTERTRGNAHVLCDALGVPIEEISIVTASLITLRDTKHLGPDEQPHRSCMTCQNVQARERTKVLMTMGFVVGTGDLSEIALGWCTYNGDHMSMYHVNAGVPKTLVKYVVGWVAERGTLGKEASTVLRDILATPISPELDPLGAEGEMGHETEAIVGPYDLHDFFIFHFLRNGFAPRKIAFLADRAFTGKFSPVVIRKWLAEFYRRFPAAQFKRNAGPDGPKVGSVALSQRGDWRMPSDITMRAWREEAERLVAELGPSA
ncbi:MAG: NAD(+) synthase [bacterium]|nr:NAD(+) synthase [bacterium]